MLNSVEHENSFITSGQGSIVQYIVSLTVISQALLDCLKMKGQSSRKEGLSRISQRQFFSFLHET